MAKAKKAVRVLSSLTECETVMGLLRTATLAQRMHLAGKAADLARIEEKYAAGLMEVEEQMEDYTASLQGYYMMHLRELEVDGKRSIELRHGVMGRRTGQPTLKLASKAWTWQSVLEKLREKWGEAFVRHHDPEVDKQALKSCQLTSGELYECGLKVEQEERFFAEPKLEE